MNALGKGVKVVKVRCPRCSEPLVVEVKPGLHLLKCACSCHLLLLADEHADVRSVRAIEVEKPLNTGRLRLARPELWPSILELFRGDIARMLSGNPGSEASLTPAAQRAIKLLLELGVLEAEGD